MLDDCKKSLKIACLQKMLKNIYDGLVEIRHAHDINNNCADELSWGIEDLLDHAARTVNTLIYTREEIVDLSIEGEVSLLKNAIDSVVEDLCYLLSAIYDQDSAAGELYHGIGRIINWIEAMDIIKTERV